MSKAIEPRFPVGSTVYVVRVEHEPIWEDCPDCCGKKVWDASLPCGDKLPIACPTCTRGYEGSLGKVSRYVITAGVAAHGVNSIRYDTEKGMEYVTSGGVFKESEVHASNDAALPLVEPAYHARREHMEDHEFSQRKHKRKDRPGSMVSYARQQIRRAKKEIERWEIRVDREGAK